LVNIKVPVFTVVNTLPNFGWLTNYLETVFSNEAWKTATTATTAFEYRKLLSKFAIKTGSPLDFVLWQGHDFSYRGLSNSFDAASASGHLASFLGTDTIPAIDYIEEYYGGMNTFVGGSVPASEHSVACANIAQIEAILKETGECDGNTIESLGGGDNFKLMAEKVFFKRYVSEIIPSGVVSYVSDTYNFWDVITEVSTFAKDAILNRIPNELGLAKVVFRPDSGDPADILCGTKIKAVADTDEAIDILQGDASADASDLTAYECGADEYSGLFRIGDDVCEVTVYPEWTRHDKTFYYIDGWGESTVKKVDLTREQKGAVECLWDIFGGTISETGHKILNQRVGLIYGDSITLERANDIMTRLEQKGFASCNVVFGIGSFTYQYVTRDTFGFAMKATYEEIGDVGYELFKDPITDSGTKKSAKGLLRVEYEDGDFVLYDQQTIEQEKQGCLKTIFKDSKMVSETTIDEIRARINAEVDKAFA
jgi:nicotinamide phosphoribosyltransferase